MGCGLGLQSELFMITFQIIFANIILNLFIAVILEGFDESSRLEDANLSEFYLTIIKHEWLKYDKEATGIIQCKDLWAFIDNIILPWERKKNIEEGKQAEKRALNTLIMRMHLPVIQFKTGDRESNWKAAQHKKKLKK